MSVNSEQGNLVSLGDYIELCDERNSAGEYTLDDIRGISTEKKFIDTKANLDGVSLTAYKVVHSDEFAYVSDTSRRGDKIALALNTTDKPVLISSIYTTFRSIDAKKLLPEYLYLIFSREEFDRLSRFNSWGSARETFDWSEFCRIQIPLPDIEIQQELVDTYNGLKALAEQNEALIKPLTEACQAYIVDCKEKYPEVELGGYIEESKEKNRELQFESKDARGVYSNGTFGDTLANLEGSNLASYKIVRNGEFAYSNRINIGSIAQCNEGGVIVSPSYTVFRVKSNEIMSKYLFILFRRKEFLRSTLFFAIGTIKDDFSYERMAEVKIPKPPIEVQQAIVNLYNCAEEAKKIATEAREKMKMLCPALVQRAINS